MGWGGAGEKEVGWRKGPWTPEEDKLLARHVTLHGEGRWSYVARFTGLNRSGKSCRLRWVNYLRPGLKKGQLTPQEEGIIIELHSLWGNKWSIIASYLPGRTDNEIKNYWRTHFKKKDKSFDKQDKRKAQFLQQQNQLQQQNEANSMMMNTRVSTSSSASSHNEKSNEIIKMDTDSREHEYQKQQNFNCMNNMIFMQQDLMEDDNYYIGAWSLSSEH